MRKTIVQAAMWCAVAACALSARAEDFRAWKYSRAVMMNTSSSGADVKGDVANFPVAIALSGENFDFSQARPDGADVRFAAGKGAETLAYSVEHWDAAGKSALVWVKVPLVKGDTAEQGIVMYWGNAEAASTGDSKKVFDTKDGFVGVWHLDEEGNNDADGFKDATGNAADATGVNMKAGTRVNGRVGRGVMLDHSLTQWIKLDNEKRKMFDLTDHMTFSIWAKARSFANKGDEANRALPGYETMMAKGDNSWRVQKFGVRDWHKPPEDLLEACVEKSPKGDLCDVGKVDIQLNEWYLVTVVQDHPKLKMYVNGVFSAEEIFDVPWKSDDHPVGIGNQSQFPTKGRSWDGVLDEARVLGVSKDEHWIKLDYESQREGQKLVTWGAVESH